MHVAYVVVRYGTEILGGAEQGCRMLAERLAARDGCTVEVFTTCALDTVTWADHFPPGTVDINGVRVHRFASDRGRDRRFESFSTKVLADAKHVSPADQDRWVELQGPVCPSALDAAISSLAHAVIFYPYLYWPTVRGVPAAGRRAIVHPAAHDEAPLQLAIFDRVIDGANGLVLQTESERRLVEDRFPSAVGRPQLSLGLGVEVGAGEPAPFRAAFGLGDTPYLLCLGRVDAGKGTTLLARLFATYKARHPGPLKLVIAGPVFDDPGPHPDVVVTGALDEAAKWGALRGASALVSPSAYEAFSIVLMESWSVGVPVLVNRRCMATAEHVHRSGGGLSFNGYADFEVSVDRLVRDDALRARLGACGRHYVEDNFAWPLLMDRYAAFLERLTG